MDSHTFRVDLATQFGIIAAILLQHIYFWTEKNAANGKHYIDGSFWTYNSVKAFHLLHPYATERKIRLTLNKLKTDGVVKTSNYNKTTYDRTLWYALTDEGLSLFPNNYQSKEVERRISADDYGTILEEDDVNSNETMAVENIGDQPLVGQSQNCQFDNTKNDFPINNVKNPFDKMSNGKTKNVEPIPVTKTVKKPVVCARAHARVGWTPDGVAPTHPTPHTGPTSKEAGAGNEATNESNDNDARVVYIVSRPSGSGEYKRRRTYTTQKIVDEIESLHGDEWYDYEYWLNPGNVGKEGGRKFKKHKVQLLDVEPLEEELAVSQQTLAQQEEEKRQRARRYAEYCGVCE